MTAVAIRGTHSFDGGSRRVPYGNAFRCFFFRSCHFVCVCFVSVLGCFLFHFVVLFLVLGWSLSLGVFVQIFCFLFLLRGTIVNRNYQVWSRQKPTGSIFTYFYSQYFGPVYYGLP